MRAGVVVSVLAACGHSNELPCAMALRMYCFAIDLDVPLTVTRAMGWHAFVSATMFDPSTGLAAADSRVRDRCVRGGAAGELSRAQESPLDVPGPTDDCSDWTDPAGGDELGLSSATGSGAFSYTSTGCGSPSPVYCLER